jgi:phage shock protein PspC (stress-responsive transcriptional regulator)
MLVDVSGNVTAGNVEETLKDFWATRPRRPHRGRKIAGVAVGIAERYRIDPVLVRVAFIAMALCNGAGILIYLLGWLLLAQEDDEVSPLEALVGRGRSATPVPLTIVLCIAILPATGFFVDGGFSMVAGVLLSVGAIYLLHHNRGSLNRPAPSAPVAPQDTTEQVTEMGLSTPQTPPAWDPLGAAPFAWDLPEPGQSPAPRAEPPLPKPRKRRTPVTGITLGLSLLVLAAAAIGGTEDAWFNLPHVIGMVVAVLGLGILVGSFVGGGKGLIGLVIPLSIVGVLGTMVTFDSITDADRMGDVSDKPTSLEQVQPRYGTKVGSINLDLRQLPNSGTVDTDVETGVGGATVEVPKNADVDVRCEADLGSVDCLGQHSDGRDPSREVTDNGPDGPGGLKIVLHVHTGVGEVVVNRG